MVEPFPAYYVEPSAKCWPQHGGGFCCTGLPRRGRPTLQQLRGELGRCAFALLIEVGEQVVGNAALPFWPAVWSD